MSGLVVRQLRHVDFDEFFSVFASAFLVDVRERMREAYREVFEPERSLGVFDGSEMVGVGGSLRPEMTLPGGGSLPLAAVTWVGVRPDQRRRGVLTSLMRAQLEGLRAHEPVAALYSTEGSIYGRFGYGLGTYDALFSLPRGAAFRDTVDIDARPVREVDQEHALEFAELFHPSVRCLRPGRISHDASWRTRLVDDRATRGDAGGPRYAVHPDGYVVYRPKPGWNERGPAYELHVLEFAAATPEAYAALWRHLLDTDLVNQVHWDKAAVDEPLPHMLADPRQARRQVFDGLWVRLVDLPRALAERAYSAPVDVVLRVTDSFCPWNSGRWRLRAETDGLGEVTGTTDEPHLDLDVTDLAAAYLGGNTLTALAGAGRVTELAPGALRRTSRAFATELAPHCEQSF